MAASFGSLISKSNLFSTTPSSPGDQKTPVSYVPRVPSICTRTSLRAGYRFPSDLAELAKSLLLLFFYSLESRRATVSASVRHLSPCAACLGPNLQKRKRCENLMNLKLLDSRSRGSKVRWNDGAAAEEQIKRRGETERERERERESRRRSPQRLRRRRQQRNACESHHVFLVVRDDSSTPSLASSDSRFVLSNDLHVCKLF